MSLLRGTRRALLSPSRRAGGAAFDPSSLSGLALWLDPASGVFQERTGAGATTPAGDGDPVGTWKARNAAVYFVAPADAARPTYRANAGKPYLEFDGSDDYLSVTTTALDAAAGCCLAVGTRPGTQVAGLPTAVGFGGTSTTCFTVVREQSGNWETVIGGQSTFTVAANGAIGSADIVVGCRWNTTADTHRTWTDTTEATPVARTAGMPDATGEIAVGTDISITTRLYVGRVYGLLAYTQDQADADYLRIVSYLQGLMG